ncbi:hypothetical protein [Tenacibaculum halocynthiae]|uniref:hypothetical protein n=1 Tax=Tenacibaculum halocynthiae TaxID=1254437 RepID=UPI003892E174
MIQIVKQPKEGAFFLSENQLEVELKSNLGSGYYFKVFITVNNKLFDIQGWSKYNDTDCKIDLKGMFSHLFLNKFPKLTGDTFTECDHLKKEVFIVIKEYKREDDVLVNSVDLNSFFILKSETLIFFDDRINLQKMSILPRVLRLSKTKVVRLPIWINSGSIVMKVVTGTNEIRNKVIHNLAKNIHEITIDLTNDIIINNEVNVFIEDVNGNSFSQQFNLNAEHLYNSTLVLFRNNFGAYESIELFGSLKESNSYKRKTYSLTNNKLFLAKTNVDEILKINTGFMLPSELSILKAINESIELYVYHKNEFYPAVPVSKKSKGINYEKDYQDDYVELKLNGELLKDTSFKYD